MPQTALKLAGSLAWLLLGWTVWPPAIASAEDSMRCGTRLVSEGDPKGKVRALCGEPTDVYLESMISGPALSRYSYGYSFYGPVWREVPVEIWTYNFGSSRLLRHLRFIGDELVDIRTSGYGY
jgi:hypothetical protein